MERKKYSFANNRGNSTRTIPCETVNESRESARDFRRRKALEKYPYYNLFFELNAYDLNIHYRTQPLLVLDVVEREENVRDFNNSLLRRQGA